MPAACSVVPLTTRRPHQSVAASPAAQLDLRFAPDVGGVTRVVQRRVCYPYDFLKPFWFGDQPTGIVTAIIQSSSGGLFGGERLLQRLRLAPHAAVHLTNQAATIVHAMRGHAATVQRVELELGNNAYLEYLPEPVTLFPGAGLEQQVRVTLAPQSVLLLPMACWGTRQAVLRQLLRTMQTAWRFTPMMVGCYVPSAALSAVRTLCPACAIRAVRGGPVACLSWPLRRNTHVMRCG